MVFMSHDHKVQLVEPGSDPNLKLDQEGEVWKLVAVYVFVASFPLLRT